MVRKALNVIPDEQGAVKLWACGNFVGVFDRIIVVGAGKAVVPMARAVEDTLGRALTGGHVITKHGHYDPSDEKLSLATITVTQAGHPVPDENGVKGTEKVLTLLRDEAGREDTLVLVLISGGGSALLTAPCDGLSLSDLQTVNKLMLGSGATIHEINIVRKHLDQVKGGRLAQGALPVVTLILSDVVGDPLDVIASGPTVEDPSSFADCRRIIDKYQLANRLPPNVKAHLQAGLSDPSLETPKPGTLRRVYNHIVGSNSLALQAAAIKAKQLGYTTEVISSTVEGEAKLVAKDLAELGKRVLNDPHTGSACLIAGGETTVTLTGSGKGGRNQELALAAAIELGGAGTNIVVFSAGTDGTDGPTDAAGAAVDGLTAARARKLGLEPAEFLARNDSNSFFMALADATRRNEAQDDGLGLLTTGPTGTNVMDVYMVLVKKPTQPQVLRSWSSRKLVLSDG